MEMEIRALEKEIILVLENYNSDDIDIIIDEDNNNISIMYHSRHNSFPVSDFTIDYSNHNEKQINHLFKEVNKLADKYDLGVA